MSNEELIAKLYARENHIKNIRDKFYDSKNLRNNLGVIGVLNEEIKFLDRLFVDYQSSRSRDENK